MRCSLLTRPFFQIRFVLLLVFFFFKGCSSSLLLFYIFFLLLYSLIPLKNLNLRNALFNVSVYFTSEVIHFFQTLLELAGLLIFINNFLVSSREHDLTHFVFLLHVHNKLFISSDHAILSLNSSDCILRLQNEVFFILLDALLVIFYLFIQIQNLITFLCI